MNFDFAVQINPALEKLMTSTEIDREHNVIQTNGFKSQFKRRLRKESAGGNEKLLAESFDQRTLVRSAVPRGQSTV